MKDDLPEHLRPTRDILLSSVRGQTKENPPPPPPGLLDDLEARLGGKRAAQPSTAIEVSLVDKLRSFFATPAFGLAAAVILVLFIAIPMMNKGPENFRGGNSSGSDAIQIVLIGGDTEASAFLQSSKLDSDAFTIVEDPATAAELDNPKILVDFSKRTLTAISADGTSGDPQPLPDTPEDLRTAIAAAFNNLNAE